MLKLKTKEFQSLTRSLTSQGPIPSCESLIYTALSLCKRVEMTPQQLYRLVGVGVSNFRLDDCTAGDLSMENVPPLDYAVEGSSSPRG